MCDQQVVKPAIALSCNTPGKSITHMHSRIWYKLNATDALHLGR